MSTNRKPQLIIMIVLIVLGSLITTAVAIQTVEVPEFTAEAAELSPEERAYFEFVYPRLNLLVTETESIRDMVQEKSRDIISLAKSGTTIETLIDEINEFIADHGVPERFQVAHERILSALAEVSATIDTAKSAIRTFDFSKMKDLVPSFSTATDELVGCLNDLESLAS